MDKDSLLTGCLFLKYVHKCIHRRNTRTLCHCLSYVYIYIYIYICAYIIPVCKYIILYIYWCAAFPMNQAQFHFIDKVQTCLGLILIYDKMLEITPVKPHLKWLYTLQVCVCRAQWVKHLCVCVCWETCSRKKVTGNSQTHTHTHTSFIHTLTHADTNTYPGIQMSWNGKRSALLAFCERKPPVAGGFPSRIASNGWFRAEDASLLWRHNGRGSVKSPASRLFTQPFIQTQIKENIKAPRHNKGQ